MRIYLDVCCLNRPFDDQTQDRIHLESEAIILILKRIRSGNWEWVSSEAVSFEDDKLLRLARENSRQLKIKVYNPLIWLKEVIENEYRNYDS